MATIRTGRATLGLLDHIRVDSYGTPTPLNQLANLHVPEPSMITIQPWDVSQIGPIERAIRVSDLGLNPANDGKLYPAADSAAHRGAPQGTGEAPARDRRAPSRFGPKCSPRWQREREEAAEGQEDHRGRREVFAAASCFSGGLGARPAPVVCTSHGSLVNAPVNRLPHLLRTEEVCEWHGPMNLDAR